jgi:pantetheine-phosphate adenylyltransferase
MKAIYPGSFNPMTRGHANILQRALTLFDEIVVMVANNPEKTYMFSLEQRLALVRHTLSSLHIAPGKSVIIESTAGIVADYVNEHGIQAIIRGIRNGADLDYEFQLEQYNQHVSNAETIYLSPYTEHLNTSSTLVRMFLQSGKHEKSESYLAPDAYAYILSTVIKQ